MKKMIVCFMVIGLFISGCTGSFNVTKKLNEVHRSQKNKWVDEAIFLGLVIIPVYGIGMLGDAVIFNAVEFWTGENPIIFAVNDAPDKGLTLERSTNGVVAKDQSGDVLYTSSKDLAGGVSVYDGNEKLVRYFSPDEVQSELSDYSVN